MLTSSKEIMLGGLAGAIIGALLTVSLTVWFDWRKQIRDVKIQEEIIEIKSLFLDDLKQNIRDAQDAVTTVNITQKQALKDGEIIRLRRDQAEKIISNLEGKTDVDPKDVATILKPEIDSELTKHIKKITSQLSCPSQSSVEKFGICIWHIGSYNKNFYEAANACKSQGGRLCTHAEVSAAQSAGAEWCSWGWVADRSNDNSDQAKFAKVTFPMQKIRPTGCGNSLLPTMLQPIEKKFGANCCK